MSQSTASKFGFRAWLFGCVAVVVAFIMASCCPIGLQRSPIENNDKRAEAENSITVAKDLQASSPQSSAIKSEGK